MAYDFLGLTNKALTRVNEVNLTSSNFASASGFDAHAKDAVNNAIRDMNQEQFDEVFTGLEYKPQSNITEYELFSHKERALMYKFFIKEIRKHDKKVEVSLCLETEN